jgi:hypothetical protein
VKAANALGWDLVPAEPNEQQWGQLARDIVMWLQFPAPHTGTSLHNHLESCGTLRPDWLRKEIPDSAAVPSKGTIATCIYKAMLTTGRIAVD